MLIFFKFIIYRTAMHTNQKTLLPNMAIKFNCGRPIRAKNKRKPTLDFSFNLLFYAVCDDEWLQK